VQVLLYNFSKNIFVRYRMSFKEENRTNPTATSEELWRQENAWIHPGTNHSFLVPNGLQIGVASSLENRANDTKYVTAIVTKN
jgi:hypothetical protein